jgi:hypothetical protein
MNGTRIIQLLIISTIIVTILISAHIKDYQIGSILGRALALIIGPYLFASLIRHGIKISSWNLNFEDKSFKKTFVILWFIYIILNVIGSNA